MIRRSPDRARTISATAQVPLYRATTRTLFATAGHCVAHGTTWHDEVLFAPGYYGAFCVALHHPAEALCGISPYSWWPAHLLTADSDFLTASPGDQKGADFGFVATQTIGGKHVAQVVGGGLSIAFCQGSSFPFHPTCDAGSGKQEQNWTAFGEPDPSVGLAHCGVDRTLTLCNPPRPPPRPHLSNPHTYISAGAISAQAAPQCVACNAYAPHPCGNDTATPNTQPVGPRRVLAQPRRVLRSSRSPR